MGPIRMFAHCCMIAPLRNGRRLPVKRRMWRPWKTCKRKRGRTIAIYTRWRLRRPFPTMTAPITAQDYTYALLLVAMPVLWETEETLAPVECIVGYRGYSSGITQILFGVRVLSSNRFSILDSDPCRTYDMLHLSTIFKDLFRTLIFTKRTLSWVRQTKPACETIPL